MAGHQDRNMAWMRKRVFIAPNDMFGISEPADGIQESAVDTTVIMSEISTLGFMPWLFADGKLLSGIIPIPYDVDPKHEIGFRIAYTMDHDGTGAGTVEWILLAKVIKNGIAITAATVGLDTVIGTSNYLGPDGAATVVDFLWNVSNRGIWLPATHQINRDDIEDGSALTFSIECQAAENETTIRYFGLFMDYVPQRCWGVGMEMDAPLKSTGV